MGTLTKGGFVSDKVAVFVLGFLYGIVFVLFGAMIYNLLGAIYGF